MQGRQEEPIPQYSNSGLAHHKCWTAQGPTPHSAATESNSSHMLQPGPLTGPYWALSLWGCEAALQMQRVLTKRVAPRQTAGGQWAPLQGAVPCTSAVHTPSQGNDGRPDAVAATSPAAGWRRDHTALAQLVERQPSWCTVPPPPHVCTRHSPAGAASHAKPCLTR